MRDEPAPIRGTQMRLARLLTELLAPANVVATLLVVVAWHAAPDSASAIAWGLLAALFASFIPLGYIVRQVHRRRLTDHHVHRREQRPRPMLVGVASVLCGVVVLALLGAPRALVALAGAMAVGLTTATLVTLCWKISVHVAVVAGAVTILVLVFGQAMLLLTPVVALVGWARVAVRDHTPAQTVAGALLGAVVAASVFTLLR